MGFIANLPLAFSASYYIDEITPIQNQREYVQVQLSAENTYLPDIEINSHWSVLYNLISRGCPTKASRWLTQTLLDTYNLSYSINEPENSHFQYILPKITEDTARGIKDSLNIIAGFQRVICWLLGSGQLKTSESITIYVVQEHSSLARIAINDLNEWSANLTVLDTTEKPLLSIQLDSTLVKDDTLRTIIKVGERSYHLVWFPYPDMQSKANPRLLTGPKIKYPALGQFDENGRLIINEATSLAKQAAAEYILQSVFRKHSFRAGQLKIINRAIQNLDVVGLLPTGGGKSLTYQFTSLLQPTITIVIDPINSLMRDQFEKLIENGIDTCLYINSYNSREEQLQNLEQLAQGYVKFAFVSPERLQIAKFRDGLKSCLANGVHIGLAVVDEAHCVSEWGHDFRHTYLRLADNLKAHCKPVKGDQLTIMALTATASFDVLTDIRRELQMDREAEQTLPVDQIERKELTYHIEKVSHQLPSTYESWREMEDWLRQKELAYTKYPILKKILKERLPKMLGLQSHRELFDPLKEGYYPRAGLIFCSTKSNARGDGVAALAYGMVNQSTVAMQITGLDTEPYLEIGTYMGGDNDNTAKNPSVVKLAAKSYDNQGDFLANKLNLMIATKAFGMGIDKPNVRFTIHYGLPNSVESFYQEAGRAGRDRNPAICMILHHESDRYTNEEFLKNSFKGQRKEQDILNEFLSEVRYEDKFVIKILTDKLKEIRPNIKTIKITKSKAGDERYLDVYGPYSKDPAERVYFGRIDLKLKLKYYQENIRNLLTTDDREDLTDKDISDTVLSFIKEHLEEQCPKGLFEDYFEYLTKTSEAGLETILNNNPYSNGLFSLVIGFTNNEVSLIREMLQSKGYLILPSGYSDWDTERIIRAAYNFKSKEDEFLDGLIYEYERFHKTENLYTDPAPLTPEKFREGFWKDLSIQDYLRTAFWRIRDIADTQRAIYRLSLLGVINDYTINYSEKTVTLLFKKKPENQYLENFKEYLKRYQGDDSVGFWLAEADKHQGETLLRKCLYTLTDFVYESIKKKRESAIEYMQKQCELFIFHVR